MSTDECRVCNGSGRVGTADDHRPCQHCGGTGHRMGADEPTLDLQSVPAAEPKCWRSECRFGCHYPGVCSELRRVTG